MEICEKLKERRKELGLTMLEVAQKIGVSEATVSRWESGDIANMRRDKIVSLASALQVSPSFIMGWEDQDDIYQYKNVIPVPPMKKIPLVGTIACGAPILAAENIECEVNMPENINADFALRCKGDSMIEAHIYDGDIVYIRKQPVVENGEIAAVLIEDEATLKRFYKSGDTITLMACNASFLPLVYTSKDHVTIQILGKAVGFTSTNV